MITLAPTRHVINYVIIHVKSYPSQDRKFTNIFLHLNGNDVKSVPNNI